MKKNEKDDVKLITSSENKAIDHYKRSLPRVKNGNKMERIPSYNCDDCMMGTKYSNESDKIPCKFYKQGSVCSLDTYTKKFIEQLDVSDGTDADMLEALMTKVALMEFTRYMDSLHVDMSSGRVTQMPGRISKNLFYMLERLVWQKRQMSDIPLTLQEIRGQNIQQNYYGDEYVFTPDQLKSTFKRDMVEGRREHDRKVKKLIEEGGEDSEAGNDD